LKHITGAPLLTAQLGSPVSDGGRGLKHLSLILKSLEQLDRPSVMAGVD
jgi:hypothetical protein